MGGAGGGARGGIEGYSVPLLGSNPADTRTAAQRVPEESCALSRLRVAPGSPYSAGTLCPQSELGWPPAHGGTLRVPPSGSQGAEAALSRCCPSLPSPSPVGCFSDKNQVSSSCCHRRGRGCRQRGSAAHCLCGDPPSFGCGTREGCRAFRSQGLCPAGGPVTSRTAPGTDDTDSLFPPCLGGGARALPSALPPPYPSLPPS